jgi:hypothetical protein
MSTQSIDEKDHIQQKEKIINKKGAFALTIYALLYNFAQIHTSGNNLAILESTLKVNETWNHYQSRHIRQTVYQMAHDDLSNMVLISDKKEIPESIQKRLDFYNSNILRFESAPETGEGKKELIAKGRYFEKELEVEKSKAFYLEYSMAALQLAIVFGSSAILATSLFMLWASAAFGLIGAVLLSFPILSLI